MRLPDWLAVAAVACACGVLTPLTSAQVVDPDRPDWTEGEVPPPPTFRLDKLLAVDVDARGSLHYGIDPSTLSIGKDGIVRYVMVARSDSGAMTAMYEGLRCGTGESITYARYNDSKWTPVASAKWRSLFSGALYKYPLAVARQGGCDNSAPPTSVRDIVAKLKDPQSGEHIP